MEKRRFRKILITGISGSGGSYLAEFLVNNHPEVEVYGVSRWHSSSSEANLRGIKNKVKIYECDLNDLSSVVNALKTIKPEGIFHLASHANVRASFVTPISVLNNNILGTVNLFEGIKLAKIDPVILLCSTSEVYGIVDPKNVPIKEDCPYNPASPYAVSKLAQDCLGFSYYLSYGLKVIRTRMFTYLNPKREDLFATNFAIQIAKIELGLQKVLLHGNLESVRTIIDVRDAVEAYWIALNRCRIGDVYNIGGNKKIKVGRVLELLKKKARCKIPCQLSKGLLRPVDVTLQIPNSLKFRSHTGWQPRYSFEESLEFLLNECRKRIQFQEK